MDSQLDHIIFKHHTLSCPQLSSATPDHPTVRELCDLFSFIKKSALSGFVHRSLISVPSTAHALAGFVVRPSSTLNKTPEEGTFYASCDLSDAHIAEEGLIALFNSPNVVLPVLEYMCSRTDFERRVADSASQSSAAGSQNLLHVTTPSGQVQCRLPRWRRVRVVPMNGPISSFADQKASSLGRLVFLRGTVMRLGTPRVICTSFAFECMRCGYILSNPLEEDGQLVFPKERCPGRREGAGGVGARRCGVLAWAPATGKCECEEVQAMRIQSFGGADDWSESRAGADESAQMMDVELRGPDIDKVCPGDVVTVGGIVSARRRPSRTAGASQFMFIKALSVSRLSRPALVSSVVAGSSFSEHESSSVGNTPAGSLASQLVKEEEGASLEASIYKEAARHPQWLCRLVDSFAPGIYGNEDLKVALLLSIVGGAELHAERRSSIHTLLIGNPGMGKSQLLRAVCALVPRAAYVSANTSSTCGLTVTLSRDPGTGETTFEAGAVVHGDGGVTAIDEIDKGVSEHKALLEVMEQQCISTAKAGMIFSIPVRTTIVAAGNPLGGTLAPGKTLAENINISPALLSRFDIVYIMKSPNLPSVLLGPRQRSCQVGREFASLTSHVMQAHRYQSNSDASFGGKSTAVDSEDRLGVDFIAGFLQYARDECQPRLSAAAATALEEIYVRQRAEAMSAIEAAGLSGAPCPVTPRRLQGLIRLSEAHAKLHLRDIVTEEDAKFAALIIAVCQALTDAEARQLAAGGGAVPVATPLFTGVKAAPAARRRMAVKEGALTVLRELCKSRPDGLISAAEIIEACEKAGAKNSEVTMNQLSEAGDVLLVSGRKYRLAK